MEMDVRTAVEQALEELWPLARHVRLGEVVDRAMDILEEAVREEVERRLAPDEDAVYRAVREAVA
jgi:gamma-glutamyl:cysteine ligase YbdK (ATP-grasp superfamily)